MTDINAVKLTKFISASPSPFHVVKNLGEELEEEGFIFLDEKEKWDIKKGGRYYTTRNASSVIAFAVPAHPACGFNIMAAHSDSPCFKIKANPEIKAENAYVKLNVEGYGGMLMAPWFDRPLSVAGRVLVKDDEVRSLLVDVDRDLLLIPSLAIHMNRQANNGYTYNIQKDLLPVLGDEESCGSFLSVIAQAAGVDREDILDFDLQLYVRQAPSFWGASGEFFSSPKLDDLECAYSCMTGLKMAVNDLPEGGNISVCAIFDNEEVGSQSKQGAGSTFIYDVLRRINGCLERSEEDYYISVANSFMVSADNGHAVHPNHGEEADPVNRPKMNGGIVIKYAANQKYTTDGVSGAICRLICEEAHIPYQIFTNRSDKAGGSTLGNIANAHVSLNTADIGLAQLAMHSAYETAGTKDVDYLVDFSRTFYKNKWL